MNLWLQISLCGLFLLVVNACDDLDEPVPEIPQVPQIPRRNISNLLIHIVFEECPGNFINEFRTYLNKIRENNAAESMKYKLIISQYSLNSTRFYAKNDLVTIQAYKPPSVIPRYEYRELAFRKSQPYSEEYSTGKKLIATPQEIIDSWMNKPNGRPASYEYDLYGKEPMEADAEKYEYFTQLVWGATREFGISCVTSIRDYTPDSNLGIEGALNKTTKEIVLNVVANFKERGNMECGYRQNVLPPRNSTKEEHLELLRLSESEQLKPTSACQSRDEFYRDMTKCPKNFEDDLRKNFNNLRAKRGGHKLVMDHYNLGAYSQEYANWLVGQPHEVIGNEPNNRFGGDIVWWPKIDTPGQLKKITVGADDFMDHVISLEREFHTDHLQDKELSEQEADEYKDFFRIIWKNSERVGFGCGLAWLPGQNLTRPIVVVNFGKKRNEPGNYKANIQALQSAEQGERQHGQDELDEDEASQGSGLENEPVDETSSELSEYEEDENTLELE